MSHSFIGILVLASFLALVYVVRRVQAGRGLRLEHVVVLIVTAAGMMGAVKLVVRLSDITGSDDDRLCIFVGALSLFWVSLEAALDIYKK